MPNKKLITPRVRRLVRAAIKRIIKEPNLYDQALCPGNKSNGCSTPNCIGGWILLLAKSKHTSIEARIPVIIKALWPRSRCGAEPKYEAVERFYWSYLWPDKIRPDRSIPSTPQQAQLRMEYWLKTDGRE